MQFLFSVGLFLSASLLFVIQPMVAKILLPVYGGTPAVWTVCMLFFQSLLLVAYGYAWLLSRFVTVWEWRLAHILLVLISLFSLPFMLTILPEKGTPEFIILRHLIYQLGLPLLVIAASAPLLQFAYSQTQGKKANDPYFLYVASNIGSLLALLTYPWVIERFIGLKTQFYLWTIGYIVYLIALGGIFFGISYQPLLKQNIKTLSLPWRLKFQWIGYSFVPCSLLLGVTFYITTDIAATPIFWVLPLALYLLSFIITFAEKPLISFSWVERNALFFFIFPVVGFILGNVLPAWQFIFFHLLNFFVFALLCHGRLIQSRPPASQLTSFYLCLAFGGMLAGVFNSLLAPRIFNDAYEYPLVLALGILCIPTSGTKTWNFTPLVVLLLLLIDYYLPSIGWFVLVKKYHVAEFLSLCIIVCWPGNRISFFVSIGILFLFLFYPGLKHSTILSQHRNFYGVKKVSAIPGSNVLISQNTVHGFQLTQVEKVDRGALGYYGPSAQVVKLMHQRKKSLNAFILGLGTGMMACQYEKNDQLKIVDIDKQVIDIAKNPQFFTYLRDCPPQVSVEEGDGRLVLHNIPNRSTDILVIDAFSSDSIPIHLLTLEAFQLYLNKVAPDGVIIVHISNRHLNLLPVLAAIGRQLDLIVLHKLQPADAKKGQLASEWGLLTANQPFAVSLMRTAGWRFVSENEERLWTDDYSNVIPLLKW
ncbi:spermidine synthase [Legionella jamestowniensis]|uniref:Spermidine synthase n=1 Tax=Legionella jamestowniensis TaxID=455 RepID=A0A0W0UZX4_9GAMM|nr:fused MFS/spermidine synthase [Legionella jamestowniensis]KTD13407.1 spermidine synthase [Legionella jamestowniensis]SFL75869.1 Spermine/spermidine synthase [Legionella jamestowniensis DSM 19215]